MAERTTITQVTQIGAEPNAGTAVAASKRLSSLSLSLNPNPEVTPFKPKGTKYPTTSVVNREWSTASVEGIPTYDELTYLLASTIAKDVPTLGVSDYTWLFESDNFEPDDPQTYTVEEGSNVRAHRAAHVLLDSWGIEFSRESVSVSGGGFGFALQDGISLTGPRNITDLVTVNGDATVTSVSADFTSADIGRNVDAVGVPAGAKILSLNSESSAELTLTATASAPGGVAAVIGAIDSIPLVPILPGSICVFMDDTYGALGTTKLLRVLSGGINVSGRWGPLWTVNCALQSFATFVETDPTVELKLLVEADAQGMEMLDLLRTGASQFFQVEATGPLIGAVPHSATFNICGKPTAIGEYTDEQGVYAIEFTMTAFYDPGWDKAFQFQLVNTLASL